MKLRKPNCPRCGSLARGTIENLQGVSLFESGTTEHAGDTDVWWESSETATNDQGHAKIVCDCGAEWFSAVDDQEPAGNAITVGGESVQLLNVGDGDEEKRRLLGRLEILGAWFHVELIQVKPPVLDEFGRDSGPQEPEDEGLSDILGNLIVSVGSDNGLQTVQLEGRPYLLFIYPHDR